MELCEVLKEEKAESAVLNSLSLGGKVIEQGRALFSTMILRINQPTFAQLRE
jgi:hypothetical protein